MKKSGIFFVFFVSLFLLGCSQSTTVQSDNPSTTTQTTDNQDYSQYVSKTPADTLQLYVFHGTNQCWTCITLGELTQKTLNEYFAEEVKSGKITYQDINAELPENAALAEKLGVRNISLYINTTIGTNESHEEQVNLMRYLNNEEQFMQALKKKIDGLLH